MKIKELIEILQALPNDAEVILNKYGANDEYEVLNISEPYDYDEFNEVYINFM